MQCELFLYNEPTTTRHNKRFFVISFYENLYSPEKPVATKRKEKEEKRNKLSYPWFYISFYHLLVIL